MLIINTNFKELFFLKEEAAAEMPISTMAFFKMGPDLQSLRDEIFIDIL